MEFVWLTMNQLNALADSDSELRKYFVSALACDELPKTPGHVRPRAYIVNTHPGDKLGEHSIAVGTKNDTCELLDSYVLPLTTYEFLTPFIVWLNCSPYVHQNTRALQSFKTASCGNYAIMYLLCKAQGESMDEFYSMLSEHDFVGNDDKVANMLEEIIKTQIKQH